MAADKELGMACTNADTCVHPTLTVTCDAVQKKCSEYTEYKKYDLHRVKKREEGEKKKSTSFKITEVRNQL